MLLHQKQAILESLRSDMARLSGIESMPQGIQEQYAPGIAKLKQRIEEERHALGISEQAIEAWARHLLDDVDYYRFSDDNGHGVNHLLERIEAARLTADIVTFEALKKRLERFVGSMDVSGPRHGDPPETRGPHKKEDIERYEQQRFAT